MEGFREGYDFFQSHAGNFLGVSEGARYVDSVETEITKLVKNLNQFSSNKFLLYKYKISNLQKKKFLRK